MGSETAGRRGGAPCAGKSDALFCPSRGEPVAAPRPDDCEGPMGANQRRRSEVSRRAPPEAIAQARAPVTMC
eukprot:1870943-Pyramimonas_sp.AAC.1